MNRRRLIGLLVCAGAVPLAPQAPSRQVEWQYYGGDPGNSRFSPLTDLNARNISGLQPVWQWKHWDAPLMIDSVLYVPYNLTVTVNN